MCKQEMDKLARWVMPVDEIIPSVYKHKCGIAPPKINVESAASSLHPTTAITLYYIQYKVKVQFPAFFSYKSYFFLI